MLASTVGTGPAWVSVRHSDDRLNDREEPHRLPRESVDALFDVHLPEVCPFAGRSSPIQTLPTCVSPLEAAPQRSERDGPPPRGGDALEDETRGRQSPWKKRMVCWRQRQKAITDSSMEKGPGVELHRDVLSGERRETLRRGTTQWGVRWILREAAFTLGRRAIERGRSEPSDRRRFRRPPAPLVSTSAGEVHTVLWRVYTLGRGRRCRGALSRGRSPLRRNPGKSRARREARGGEVLGPREHDRSAGALCEEAACPSARVAGPT
jgi:hypothetical protein